MTEQELYSQAKRLQTQWPTSYGEERLKLFWDAFGKEPLQRFTEAVTHCLANNRAAPLIGELNTAMETVKAQEAQQRVSFGMAQAGARGILDHAARLNTTADPEFVKACTKLLRQKIAGEITPEQFREGCGLLDSAARQLSGFGGSPKPSGRERATGEAER